MTLAKVILSFIFLFTCILLASLLCPNANIVNAQSNFLKTENVQRDKHQEAKIVTRSLPQEEIKEDFVVAKVLSVSCLDLNQELLQKTGIVSHQQKIKAQILEGKLKGKIIDLNNELSDNPAFNISLKAGSEVVLSITEDNKSKSTEINIADHHRTPVLIVLSLIFLISFLFFGGKTGFKSLCGLVLSIILIAYILLPLSLQGYNPLLTASLTCMTAGIITIISVAGFGKKAQSAFAGTFGGILISGISAQWVINSCPLTGLASEEAQILRASINVLNQNPHFFTSLLAASMLIGALGVIMDVAISIASATYELSQSNNLLSESELYKRGMNVGKDIMGSMTSTLVLAYAGSALPLLILVSNSPSIKLLNLDLLATELASALCGSLGLVFTIPISAFAAAKLMTNTIPKVNRINMTTEHNLLNTELNSRLNTKEQESRG